jgi:phosphate-selective porin OprO/OprP
MSTRAPGARVALVVMAAWLGVSGCLRPGPGPVPTPAGPPVDGTVAIQGPPSPGIRLPGWLPRGEVYWEQGVRYRLLNRPRMSLDGGLPSVGLGDDPLIEGRVGFKLNVDGAAFVARDGMEDVPDRVEVRRAFLTSSGTAHLVHPVLYNLEIGLIGGDVYLDSAWLMVRDVPWVGTLKLGGLDAPIGFDNVVSSRDRTLMELAAPVQAFVPATSLGIQARRTHHEGRGSWALGWFTVGQRRDVGDQSRALARVVGRTTWLLRDHEAPAADRWPELLHVGLAGAYTFAGTSSVHYQARPESFLAPALVDTGTIESRNAFVLGLETAARRGPLSFQGEYLQAFVDRSTGGFPGLYLAAACLFTGEVRPYEREPAVFGQVVPARPLDLRARTFGAFEGAARYSWVDLDDGSVDGGRMHVVSAGLNWYWNRWVRWQAGYELAVVGGGSQDGRLHVFQARFQLVL